MKALLTTISGLLLLGTAGCDLFLHDVGGPGDKCRKDDTCNGGLICVQGQCCVPKVSAACTDDGHPHWLDSCGNAHEALETCADCEHCVEYEAENTARCEPAQENVVIQCYQDGDAHYFDSCGYPGDVVLDCDDTLEVCFDISDEAAECRCRGNRDPATDCQTCLNHWVDEGNQCTTCPGNWDPDSNCAECIEPWVDDDDDCRSCAGNYDPASGCTSCIGNWDPATDCTACKNAWVDEGNDCGTCPEHWDQASDCAACRGNWDLATDCRGCRNHYVDQEDDCGTCPDNFDPYSDCSACLPGWDIAAECAACLGNREIATGCQTCLPHYVDEDNDCGSCAGNWDPATECQTCLNHWTDAGDDCGTCPGNWDPAADCASCVGNWDPGQDCAVCLDGYQDHDGNNICEPACLPGDCGPDGTCVDDSGLAECQCDPGYQDNDDNLTCLPNCATIEPCPGHASCDDATGVAVCICDDRWEGPDCDRCADGWGGLDCDVEVVGLTWIPISGGTFEMGSVEGGQTYTVTVPDFEIAMHEVTVDQYYACVDAGVCSPVRSGANCGAYSIAGRNDHAIVCNTWQDAADYCAWVQGRLPSESEREYAARSQGQNNLYPWGNDAPTPCVHLNASGCIGEPTTVCSYSPLGDTEQGLCDMAGNTWERTADCWSADLAGVPDDGSPRSGPAGCWHALRGGSCNTPAASNQTTYRHSNGNQEDHHIGFRCAR